MKVRTRFAPSPTGYLHVGGARTALFSYFYAKKAGGDFVLRVEDTDSARNTEEARAAIFDGLKWLGLDWEGPQNEGQCGPYYQSQRQSIYEEWFAKLVAADRVYEDDGAWRFRFERKMLTFTDQVCGEISIDYRDESNTPDMVVRRSDGSFVFHLVNVVDDLTMGITDVIRGEDHLMNTPKHLQLIEAFGETPPSYAHLPLILNENGSKMSKRDAGAALGDYQKNGFLPAAVVNFLALLGWSPKDDREIFSMAELVETFDLSGVNRAPARFDATKCRWLNQQHLLALEPAQFAKTAQPWEPKASEPMLTSIREKVSLLTEVPDAVSFFLNPEFPYEEDTVAKVKNNPAAAVLLQDLAAHFETLTHWSQAKDAIGQAATAAGAKPGQLMFPTRVALSGRSAGPDLGEMLQILGQTESIRRLRRFVNHLS